MEDYQKRMVEEYNELCERINKLSVALRKKDFIDKVGVRQYTLMQWQYYGMLTYERALYERCNDMGILTATAENFNVMNRDNLVVS